MCVQSVIYDLFDAQPDEWYTLDRIDLFRDMTASAIIFDKESGQPDCVDPEKVKLEKRIEELESLLKEYKGADHD